MKKHVTVLSFFLLFHAGIAQTADPCSTPEAAQFDFWLGTWSGIYSDTLKPVLNIISKPIGNCLIEENFFDPNNSFRGKSLSAYNAKTKKWQQTWVDNTGAYISLTGEFNDGKMQLFNEMIKADGKKIIQRMLYFNITDTSFDWSWEASADNGITWATNWKIHYKRMEAKKGKYSKN